MSQEVRVLPTEWLGKSMVASWGLVFGEQHPKFETHGHLDPAIHSDTNDVLLTIVAQEGRVLQVTIGAPESHQGDIPSIGLLSADGTRLEIAGPMGHCSLTIDGNSMEGHSHYRMHGKDSASEEYGVSFIEYTAKT
ncbi:MAG: hypothetical protein F2881_10875 [Actinobacteria bacterium]|uniref:Unannotated protein n=1 Tax=freshwater metagenome TaxID=449393 RepID=A0A6J7RG18_9ZZZZ|nr:hypothetical protein [Actinomycetota bacterium]